MNGRQLTLLITWTRVFSWDKQKSGRHKISSGTSVHNCYPVPNSTNKYLLSASTLGEITICIFSTHYHPPLMCIPV